MGDISTQEFPPAEIKIETPPHTSDKNDVAKPEMEIPKNTTFGSIEVKEDLNTDLLTPHEKNLYMGGFAMLEDVVNASENNVVKMVLTNPDISSGIVGLQPLVSMKTGEAILLYQAYRHARIDFNQDYSFLEFGKERHYMKIFVNDRAAENVLRTYQKELGVILPDRVLQKDEILSYTTQLLGSSDVKKANLAHGLLSGFPLEDCQYWINDGQATINGIPPLKKVENLDNDTPIPGSDKVMRTNPISLLDPNDYEMGSTRNQFLPDTRTSISQGTKRGIIEGFGLRWATQFPPQETTIRHAQKLLQVDREVGLLNFVNQQRETFNVVDNMKRISIEKELLNGTSTKLGGIGGPVGLLALGIFSLFAGAMGEMTKPPPPPIIEQPKE